MASKRSIARNMRDLRALIESTKDPIVMRIAYEMETAIRWALEDTDWPGLVTQAKGAADMLRNELAQQEQI